VEVSSTVTTPSCAVARARVLEAFTRPLTLSAALEVLGPRTLGAHDWVELTETVIGLWRAGVLVAADPAAARGADRVDAAPVHLSMLDDRTRTSRFLAAIRTPARHRPITVSVSSTQS